MTAQQLTLDDAERESHINRLDRSLIRWRAGGLDRILPDEYARYCATLAHLRSGGAYIIRDVTEDILRDIGTGIHATVMASDRAERARRKAIRAKKEKV